MSDVVDLVRALLGGACRSDDEAVRVLDEALLREVEPLSYFAQHFGIGETETWRRAAAWCGLPFAEEVPVAEGRGRVARVDELATATTLRAPLGGRDVVFTAPGLAQLVRLRRAVLDAPELRRRICVVPLGVVRAAIVARCAEALMDQSRQRLARRWPFATVHLDLPLGRRVAFAGVLLLVVALAAFGPGGLEPLIVPMLVLLLVLPSALRLAAALRGPGRVVPETAPIPEDSELPIYTVLVPLRDEAHMVPQLVRSLAALDYPEEKLDIKFVVEATSAETIAAVAPVLDDPRFELVTVPHAAPQTKPKALNYALPLVRGRYLVVYDAEDIPHPQQLRQAAARFAADPGLDCIQAELVVDNAAESWLARLYAGEYAGLFGLFLPALARWRMTVPLGGTSNHIRARVLREVGGWDAFNVTEDADLGVRLSRLRYRTETLASPTREEAPFTLRPWLAQRTRWIKGWMQTFLVHNMRPRALIADMGLRNFLVFEMLVGGMILSAPLQTAFALVLLGRLLTPGGLGADWSNPWLWAQLFIFVAGYAGAFALAVLGLVRLGRRDLIVWQLLLPAYWFLIGIASLRAIWELMVRPYFWAKTTHGVTRVARDRELPPPRPSSAGSMRPDGEHRL